MILKRVLTRKSKFGIGKIKDYTVQDLLNRKKHFDLIRAYFNLSTIDFTEDILAELLINGKYVIPKPNVSKENYHEFLLSKYGKKRKIKNNSKIALGKEQRISKSELRSKNQKN
jgi:hypothetical protein